MSGEGGFSDRDTDRRMPTAEENALFSVMTGDADKLDAQLEDLLPGELQSLYRWADTLRLEVWDQLGKPDMGRAERLP